MKKMYIVQLENEKIAVFLNQDDIRYDKEKHTMVCNFPNELNGLTYTILAEQKIRKIDNANDFWKMFLLGMNAGRKQAEKEALQNADRDGLVIETEAGDIVVTKKTDPEYPGVYVDLKGESVNETLEKDTASLAMIEFNPLKRKVQAVIYGDGEKEEPFHIVEYENMVKETSLEDRNAADNKLTFEKELWKKFYMNFEEPNETRCLQAFCELKFVTASVDEIHLANQGWVQELMDSQGYTKEEILQKVPEAKEIFMESCWKETKAQLESLNTRLEEHEACYLETLCMELGGKYLRYDENLKTEIFNVAIGDVEAIIGFNEVRLKYEILNKKCIEKIINEAKVVKSYVLFDVGTKCIFENGSTDWVNYFVYAKTEFQAFEKALKYLRSGSSGLRIKRITEQKIKKLVEFIADEDLIYDFYEN